MRVRFFIFWRAYYNLFAYYRGGKFSAPIAVKKELQLNDSWPLLRKRIVHVVAIRTARYTDTNARVQCSKALSVLSRKFYPLKNRR